MDVFHCAGKQVADAYAEDRMGRKNSTDCRSCPNGKRSCHDLERALVKNKEAEGCRHNH